MSQRLDASLWLAITTPAKAEAFVALAVEFNPIKASDFNQLRETAPDVAEALDRWVTWILEQPGWTSTTRPIVQPLDQFITRLAGMTADEARSTRKHIEVHKASGSPRQFFVTWAKASNDTQMAVYSSSPTNSKKPSSMQAPGRCRRKIKKRTAGAVQKAKGGPCGRALDS